MTRTYGNGAWTGELHLLLLEDKARPSTRAGRSLWAVARPLTYRTRAGDTITLPAGMVTDLASIPRAAWGLLPPDGPWALAAVVHDHLCDVRKPYTSAQAARILSEAMMDLNVTPWKRLVIWAAVRVFGPQWS